MVECAGGRVYKIFVHLVLDEFAELLHIHNSVVVVACEPGCAVILLVLLRCAECIGTVKLTRSVLASFVCEIVAVIVLFVQAEVHPLVVQTGSYVHSTFLRRLSLSERGFHRPGEFVHNAVILCYVAVFEEIVEVETDSLRNIVAVADCDFFLCNRNLSACTRLVFNHIRNGKLACLHLHADAVHTVHRHSVGVGCIPFGVEILEIAVAVLAVALVAGVVVDDCVPVAQMDDVLNVSTENVSCLIVFKRHLHISRHNHVGREIVGIFKLPHRAGIFHSVKRIAHLAFSVLSVCFLDVAGTVLIFQRSLFRDLAIFEHIERKLRLSCLREILEIHKIRIEIVFRIFRILALRSVRVHIDEVLSSQSTCSSLFVAQHI